MCKNGSTKIILKQCNCSLVRETLNELNKKVDYLLSRYSALASFAQNLEIQQERIIQQLKELKSN